MFIAFGDDLIEILDSLGRNGFQAEIVQDEQVVSQDTSEMAGVGSTALPSANPLNPYFVKVLAGDATIFVPG